MFNKLIVSTNERRKARTARFFCATSIIYATTFASILALTVLASNPRLADTGERALALIAPPAPSTPVAPQQTSSARPSRPSQVIDLRMPPVDFDKVRNSSAPPPTIAAVWDPNTAPGSGAPGGPGIPGLIDSVGHDGGAPPPPQQIEPARPKPTPPVDTTTPMRLPSVVLQGKAIERLKPEYPALARQIHLAGSVSVEVMITPDGRVETARAVSGHPLFVKAALQAARQWRFGPTLLNGVPVRVTGVIVFNFTLE